MQRASRTMNQQTRSMENRWKQSQRVFSSSIALPKLGAGLAAGAAGLFTADAVRQLLDTSTRIRNALKQTGLEGAELTKVYERLSTSAKSNFAPVESLVTLYGKLSLTQKELGASQEQLLEFTDKVGVALRAGGTSATQASGALLQLSQALGGGVVRAEEFNSILEGAPGIARAAAIGIAEAGGSVAKLRQLVVDGEIDSKEFFDGFLRGANSLKKGLKNVDTTIEGAFTNLGTTLVDIAFRFDEASGTSKFFAEFLNGPLTQAITGVGEVLITTAEAAGLFGKILDGTLKKLQEAAAAAGRSVGANNLGEALGLGPETRDQVQKTGEAIKKYLNEVVEFTPRRLVSPEQLKQLEELKNKYNAGEISVEDLQKEINKLVALNPNFKTLADSLNPLIQAFKDARAEAQGLAEDLSSTKFMPRDAVQAETGRRNTDKFLSDRDAEIRRSDYEKQIAERTKEILEAAEKAGIALTEGAAKIQAASEIAAENAKKSSEATTTAATELIKGFESFSSKPYWDVNAFRAGFGSDTVTLDDGSVQRVTRGISVTLEQANRDLARRIGEFQSVIERQIGRDTFRAMGENQQAALTSIAYNYGSLPERIVEAIKTGNVETISNAIRGLQGDNGGINAGRRNKEADIFESGASDLVREDIELRRQQADVIRQTMEAIRQQNAAIGEETALLGTSNAEKERARLVTETLNELQRQGIEITDELRAQVEAEAGARYNQVQAYDQAIAKTEELKQSQEELARIQEEVGSAFSGAIKGFISDLAHGKSLTEALTNAVSRLADRLLDIALDNLFSSALSGGGGGGGFGGIFRSILSIFGFAKGGYTGDGGKYQPAGLVHRGEFVVNKEATARNRALLEAMNDRRKLPGFASGGFVGFGEGYSLPKMFGTGGGGAKQFGEPANINLNMTVYAQDAQSFRESQNQIAARTANALRPALRTS